MIKKNYPTLKDLKKYKTIIKDKLKNKKVTCSMCKKQIKSNLTINYAFRENSKKYSKLNKSKKSNPKLMESLYTDLRFAKLAHKSCSKKHLKRLLKNI